MKSELIHEFEFIVTFIDNRVTTVTIFDKSNVNAFITVLNLIDKEYNLEIIEIRLINKILPIGKLVLA